VDRIINNLQTPSWWFDGIFFVVIAILLPKIASTWAPQLWRYLSSIIPAYSMRLSRGRQLKSLKTIKANRQHPIKINWIIARYWALSTITIIYMVFCSITYLSLPGDIPNPGKTILLLVLFGSMYGLVFVTIKEKKISLRIIDAHLKWQRSITLRSRGTGLTARP
jgi:hypothetical protein